MANAVELIDKSLDEIERALCEHTTAIRNLKQSRATLIDRKRDILHGQKDLFSPPK